ncbi:MAG: putative toxin-antitoxin system toxin component, PIN family [Candidatus Hadarchaeota archaeon]
MTKSRVFLDTNILVSGMAFAGNERKLLDAIVDGKLTLVLSADVIREANAVLKKKFPKHAVLFPLFLQLVKHEEIPKNAYKSSEKLYAKLIDDESDVPILTAAAVGKTDYLATGDKKLLALKQIGCIEIIQTRALLKRLNI